MPEKIVVKKREIHRVEFVVEVPVFSPRMLNAFVARNLKALESANETDGWILNSVLNSSPRPERPFVVCFRSPADLGISGLHFQSTRNFSRALGGETLGFWEVAALCCAIYRLPKTGPDSILRTGCGVAFHVLSLIGEAGKHRRRLQISRDSEGPTLALEETMTPTGLFFNPTSSYGVAEKR